MKSTTQATYFVLCTVLPRNEFDFENAQTFELNSCVGGGLSLGKDGRSREAPAGRKEIH